MAATETVVGASTVVLPHVFQFHSNCVQQGRESLEPNEFEAADEEGGSLGFEDSITYALGTPPSAPTTLTRHIP